MPSPAGPKPSADESKSTGTMARPVLLSSSGTIARLINDILRASLSINLVRRSYQITAAFQSHLNGGSLPPTLWRHQAIRNPGNNNCGFDRFNPQVAPTTIWGGW